MESTYKLRVNVQTVHEAYNYLSWNTLVHGYLLIVAHNNGIGLGLSLPKIAVSMASGYNGFLIRLFEKKPISLPGVHHAEDIGNGIGPKRGRLVAEATHSWIK